MSSKAFLTKVVSETLERAGFRYNDKLILAFSGGRDSVALALTLKALNFNPLLAHVNYGLRGEESHRDEQFVVDFSLKNGFECKVLHATLTEEEKKGDSVQAICRKIRYDWFKQLMITHHYKGLLTAHHLQDQAETLLLNIGRKAGLKGLGGMLQVSDKHVRPFLYISREDITLFLEEIKIKWVEDSSNHKNDYRRNGLRNLVIPTLNQLIPNFDEAALQATLKLQEAYYWLEEAWWPQLESCIVEFEGGYLISLKDQLKQAESATLWHILLHRLGLPLFLLEPCVLLSNKPAGKMSKVGDWHLERRRKELFVTKSIDEHQPSEITIAGEGTFQWGNKVLCLTKVEHLEPMDDSKVCFFDHDHLKLPLVLRSPQAGERMQSFGMNGTKKLSDLNSELNLPLAMRQNYPVLCQGAMVIWAVGVKRSNHAPVTPSTKLIWRAEWKRR
jgi:tRNA(Ile)-lysidine synthase